MLLSRQLDRCLRVPCDGRKFSDVGSRDASWREEWCSRSHNITAQFAARLSIIVQQEREFYEHESCVNCSGLYDRRICQPAHGIPREIKYINEKCDDS